jgi:PAS domain S-box-containing protein
MSKYIIADASDVSISAIKSLILKLEPKADILCATNESDLFSLVLSKETDIVLITLELPHLNGIEVCKRLKTNPHCIKASVILYGTKSVPQHLTEAIIESGAEAFFQYPFNELSLNLQLRTILKTRHSDKYKAVDHQSIKNQNLNQNEGFENALKNSKSKYQGIFDANNDGISIFYINQDKSLSCFVEANKAAYSMLGYTKDEFLSKTVFDLAVENIRNVIISKIESLQDESYISVITKLKHKEGSIINVDITIIPIQYNNQFAIMNIVRDLTIQEKAEADILEKDKLYRNLLERLPDGVYKSTHDGKFVEINDAMVKMLGYDSKQELLAIDIKTELYFEPEDRESLVLQEKYEEMGIFRLKKKDGSGIWVEDHGWYSLDANGEVLFHEGILRDITERKIAEEELQESEERFKMLYEKAPIGYQSLDENWYLIDVNQTWLEMTGYPKNEVIGRWFGDFLTPEYTELFANQFPIFKTSGAIQTMYEMVKKDRTIITIQIEGRISHTTEGGSNHTHCVLSDITERRKAEKAIADERILLRTLIDNIPDPIYVKDTQGRKLISNRADLEVLGFTNESSVFEKTDIELSYPGDALQTFRDDMAVIQTAQPILNKLEFFTDRQGTKRYYLTSKIPLTNDSGEIIGLVGVGHDITAQKQGEQKIIQLSKGIEQSPASIIITDISGNIEYVNSKFTEITGYTSYEVKGKNPKILQSEYTSAREYKKLWNTISSGNEYHTELQNRKKNGELHWESILISPIRNEEGTIINYMAIKEDITNRKKTDLEILKLSVAIEQNPASVVITDTQGVIEYVNKKFVTVSGYSNHELIGKILRILKPGHTTDDVYNEIWNNLSAGKIWKGEHQNRTKNNETYWESVQISPIKNQEGKITNFVVLSENISERKKMEKDLITAKEKAEESDRLKSAFLANMSHEIRTPLNSILGFSDLLIAPDLDTDSRREFANLINSSGNNLLSIINDILDISKIEAGQITLINNDFSAYKLISEIQKEYSYKAIYKGIEFKLKTQSEAQKLIIRSDESRIKQVLINFVGNALKFTNSGYIEIGVALNENNMQFYVKDTGIGIPKEYHDKIFDRFRQVEAAQTRKYGGNGLGLAITKNLAELMGGNVWLESEPNVGSTFYFSLPKDFIVNKGNQMV